MFIFMYFLTFYLTKLITKNEKVIIFLVLISVFLFEYESAIFELKYFLNQ